MYQILPYTYEQAKKLNVIVKPSAKKGKKIDVYANYGVYIISVGSSNFKDYPMYLREEGKEYAERRRILYKQRHEKDRHVVGSAGYYADKLLW